MLLCLQDCYDECRSFQDSIKRFDRLLLDARTNPDVDEVQVISALKDMLGPQLDRILATARV